MRSFSQLLKFAGSSLAKSAALALALALSACSFDAPKDRGIDTSASFFVGDAAAKFTSQTNLQNFSIPVAKTLSLKACLKNTARSSAIVNQDFEIGNGETSKTVTTDSVGCLVWEEEMQYNSLAEAKYIQITRSIKAIGREKGTRNVDFVVSPWSNGAYSLTDSRIKKTTYVNESEGKKALRGLDAKSQRSLWIDDLRIMGEEKSIGVMYYDFRTIIQYERVDELGVVKAEPLTQGSFRARFSIIHIVAVNGKETRQYLAQPTEWFEIPKLVNGSLQFGHTIDLPRVCSRGQVHIGLEIEPVNAPANLKGFQGVFHLGECESLKGSQFGRLKDEFSKKFSSDKSYSLEKFIGEAPGVAAPGGVKNQTNGGKEVETPDFYQPTRVEIEPPYFNAQTIDGANTQQRVRSFDAKACLSSNIDQKSVRYQKFNVTKIDGTTEAIATRNDGCLYWTDYVPMNYFARECQYVKTVRIENKNLGMNQTYNFLVNPRTEGSGAVRFMTANFKDKARCVEQPSEIRTTSYSFDKEKFEYEIDEALNLELTKVVALKIDLDYKRASLSSVLGFNDPQPVPVGQYLIRYAVVDIDTEDLSKVGDKVFVANKVVLPVRGNSMILEKIQLRTRNVRAIGNTNLLVMEIVPLQPNAADLLKNSNVDPETLVDTAKDLRPITFAGPISLAEGYMAGPLMEWTNNPGGNSVNGLIAQLAKNREKTAKRAEALKSPQVFAAKNSLSYINAAQESASYPFRRALTNGGKNPGIRVRHAKEPVANDVIKKAVASGIDKNLANQLCTYWFMDLWQRKLVNKDHGMIATTATGAMSPSMILMAECQNKIKEMGIRSVFDIETKIFPKRVELAGKDYKLPGFARDLSINQSFSLGKSFAETYAENVSWDIAAGLKAPEIPFLSLVNGSTGTRFQISKSESATHSQGNVVNYTGGINLGVEKIPLKLRAHEYKKCLAIRLNPSLFVKREPQYWSDYFKSFIWDKSSIWIDHFNENLSPKEREHYSKTGLLICDDYSTRGPVEIAETWYVMNQRATQQALDTARDQNRPFFQILRGERDMMAFMSYLQNSQGIPATWEPEYQRAHILHDPAMEVFLKGVPTYPGVITIDK